MTDSSWSQRSVLSPFRFIGVPALRVEGVLWNACASNSASAIATEEPHPALDNLYTKLQQSSVGWHSVLILGGGAVSML